MFADVVCHLNPKPHLLLCADLSKSPVDYFSAGLVDDSNVFEWDVTIIGPSDTILCVTSPSLSPHSWTAAARPGIQITALRSNEFVHAVKEGFSKGCSHSRKTTPTVLRSLGSHQKSGIRMVRRDCASNIYVARVFVKTDDVVLCSVS